jgi:hypothetical protein
MARQQYNVRLEDSEVDGYWRVIGMAQSVWMGLPKSQRVQTAWADMQVKIAAAEEATRRARESQGN